MKSTPTFFLLLALLLGSSFPLTAQSTGDTIRVQGFNFNSTTRDTVLSFPDLPNVTFEKIMLKYSMRCKDGLVSTSANRDLGCGEWDYSCNTYLVDSTKVEEASSTVKSHHITNFSDLIFYYKNTPVYDYYRGIQKNTVITATASETTASIGSGSSDLSNVLSTDKAGGKSQYLYTAAALSSAGLSSGDINGLSLKVQNDGGEAKYMKIRLKQTTKSELNGEVDLDGFTEVYYQNTQLQASASNRFQFHTPFAWDGSSNIIVEFSFSNIDAGTLASTQVEGESLTQVQGLSATSEQQIFLTNNAYIECQDYKGIAGAQNRTIEAWIKTSSGANAEICSWGANVSTEKWVFRLTSAGVLRLENAGGGTESTKTVNDGQWHHVACVLDGDNLADIKFYIDGVLDANSTVGNTDINTNAAGGINLRISRGVNNRYLDAEIDELKIWDTNLSGQTISNWMRLKLDSSHPNFANLQLYYQFNESNGTLINDSSPNSRNATVIGTPYFTSLTNGVDMFRDFSLQQTRPNIDFHQGSYTTNETDIMVDRPVEKELEHFVIERSIITKPSDQPFDDEIVTSAPVQYWLPEEHIFDEVTGDFITTNDLTPDGEIVPEDLSYTRRFPFYNELVSFVTPYGIGLDLGMEGKSWYFDMSDYVHILKGNRRLLMTLGGQWQEDMDLEFMFIVGTPPRDVVQYEQIWQGTNRIGSARINDILFNVKMAPVTLGLSAEASTFKLKSSITGHGAEGEFQQNGGPVDHRISLDFTQRFSWNANQECSENPIFPQGGTWVYDRQGWCPGERSLLTENDITPFVTPGGNVNIDYTTTSPINASGDYRYHVAHQLVGYGAANHQLDAAIVEVIAPNNSALYTRIGRICANPTIRIQNTGATPLTSLTIKYWLNNSSTPQTYQWSGDLKFMETEEVEIPSPRQLWFDIQDTNNRFHVEISQPNQGTDEYSYNNTYTSAFDFPEIIGGDFKLEFRTNNRPAENNYQLLDADGNVVGNNILPSANTTYVDEYNLPDGCYKLIVNDSGDDGLEWWANPGQGAGFVSIKGTLGNLLKNFEPDFGGRFEYSFSTNFPVSVEELEFLSSIKVFPNPTGNYCTVEAEDIINSEVSITNLLGQVIEPPVLSSSDDAIRFNLNSFPAGIYSVTIKKGDVITSRKVIKQ